MNIKKGVFVLGGLTLTFAGAAIYSYFKDYHSLLSDSKIKD